MIIIIIIIIIITIIVYEILRAVGQNLDCDLQNYNAACSPADDSQSFGGILKMEIILSSETLVIPTSDNNRLTACGLQACYTPPYL
jgi:hypothetical protein